MSPAVMRATVVALALLGACAGDDAGDATATSSATTSTPETLCGDGRVDPGEACDDGVNDGSYGGCMPFCQAVGPYCGNGLVDPGEVCDDAEEGDGYGSCTTDCQGFTARCGDGVVDHLGPFGLCGDFNCCGERCDDDDADDSDGLRCDDCVIRSTGGLSGCASADAPLLDFTVTSGAGTSTFTRAYFAEVSGDFQDPESVTGASFRFVGVDGEPTPGELPGGPALKFQVNSDPWCIEGGVPDGGRWGGTMTGARHSAGGTNAGVPDVTLVVDGMDPETKLVHGHLEGAVEGPFAAAYCDTLVVYNEFFPD
jgi:cysteine-rich repeat protein